MTDFSIWVAIINLVNTIANIFWSLQLKSLQVKSEVVHSLREDNTVQEDEIQKLNRRVHALTKELSIYQRQYHYHRKRHLEVLKQE
jgi:hypothetical protein